MRYNRDYYFYFPVEIGFDVFDLYFYYSKIKSRRRPV